MTAPVERVQSAVRAGLAAETPVLLAVSGGLDSMVLLDAACAVARDAVTAVATFDHGTGAPATRAAALVARAASDRGVRLLAGRETVAGTSEAAWRDARWRFLRESARDAGARVVATAHTRDDQLETVVMRVLRGAGARGLAALAAPSSAIVRPLLDVGRATIADYAAARGVAWIDDPSNRSPRFLRNRVRHALLPALHRVRPALGDELIALALAAAEWRRDVDAFVDAEVPFSVDDGGALHVATAGLAGYDAAVLAVLWPAIAARDGVRLDRRGTARLVEFTTRIAAGAGVGAEMQLSGAIDVTAGRGEIVLRPRSRALPLARGTAWGTDGASEVPLVDDLRLGRWRFRRTTNDGGSVWHASLPAEGAVIVRPWRPGDRMRPSASQAARRVKRFFADARIAGRARAGWPVVLAGADIVWIPGVRRSSAAMDRPGRPGVHYLCERIDG